MLAVVAGFGLSLVFAGELFTNRIRLFEDDEEEEDEEDDEEEDEEDDDEEDEEEDDDEEDEEEEEEGAVASDVETKASALLDNELLFTDCGDLGLIPFTFCKFD
jgi:hypothetical protein